MGATAARNCRISSAPIPSRPGTWRSPSVPAEAAIRWRSSATSLCAAAGQSALRRYYERMNSPIRGFLTSFRVQAQIQGNLTDFRVQVPSRTHIHISDLRLFAARSDCYTNQQVTGMWVQVPLGHKLFGHDACHQPWRADRIEARRCLLRMSADLYRRAAFAAEPSAVASLR